MKDNNYIIIGAGDAGRIIFKELKAENSKLRLIGFVDDDDNKIGTFIEGIKVLGKRSDLKNIIQSNSISLVVIALPSAKKETIWQTARDILDIDESINIQILPKITKFFDTTIISDLKEVNFSDIITRDEITLDLESMVNYYQDKTVLITGAGGSIGSELAKQVLRFKIKKLICLGRGENSIYNLSKSLNTSGLNTEIQYHIIDVKDFELISKTLQKEKIDIIFHAAAHKHVPLMETNEIEAVQNNVGGTNNVLKFAAENHVKKFILVSTDKAVKPVNIMGATKRLAEILTLHYNMANDLKTSVVRFGNVLGSRGSVIPLFLEQIKKGGPVTVTHPDMERYFMSIPEASLLVINSAAYSNGGETFILDMGKQYKILEIAEKVIVLNKKIPYQDIDIVFTGLRPGEKLREDLYDNNSDIQRTKNEKIFKIKSLTDFDDDIIKKIFLLISEINKLNNNDIRSRIKKIIPEFTLLN